MRTPMMIAALLSLSLAACATDDTTYDGDKLPGPTVQKYLCPHGCNPDVQSALNNGEWIPLAKGAFARVDTLVPGTSVCQALPATGGCQFACEPDQFVETLPVGTCAAIHCAFPDGGEVVVGGCH